MSGLHAVDDGTATAPPAVAARMGRPRGFDRQAALRTAMLLFWERGYDGVSIADLNAAIGIRTASLYAAFGSKKQLYREARSLYLSEVQPLWVWPTHGTLRSRIEKVLDMSIRTSVRPALPRGCMVMLSFTEATPSQPDLADEGRAYRRKTAARITDLLADGLRAGELEPGTNVDQFGAYLATVLLGIHHQARDGMEEDQLRGVAAVALGQLPFVELGAPA